MKKFLLGLIGVAALAGPVAAADLPARTYTKAPYVDPGYNWTGFYLGVNAGGAWGGSNAATTTVFSPIGYFATTSPGAIAIAGAQHLNSSGFTGGLTAGYNWQSSNVLFGLELGLQLLRAEGIVERYRRISVLRADRLHRELIGLDRLADHLPSPPRHRQQQLAILCYRRSRGGRCEEQLLFHRHLRDRDGVGLDLPDQSRLDCRWRHRIRADERLVGEGRISPRRPRQRKQ